MAAHSGKIVILDTSVLCVWLRVPGFTHAGPADKLWDYARVAEKIAQEIAADATLVLPLTTLIESGNHIAQAKGDSFPIAQTFCDLLQKSIDSTHPWAAFSEQAQLWDPKQLTELAQRWPAEAARGVSLGDATIIEVATYYANALPTRTIEIFTGDQGLQHYQLPKPKSIPRRRR